MHEGFRHSGCFKYFNPNFWRYWFKRQTIGCVAGLVFFPLFCCLIVAPLTARGFDSSLSIWYVLIPIGLFGMILFLGLLIASFLIYRRRSR